MSSSSASRSLSEPSPVFVHLSFDFVLRGVPVCLPGRNDEANNGNADLIASDEYTPLLGDSFLP
ncbi:hypothetical protein Taro_034491 [Colocasia esculenta]|uniref:Uncharacterized protein n=1 Tax=Colocasia esculenta TaxID=4460 RepID=A0A843WC26_COLES|nr:hypothetical protein [Colocasia esculenta]